LARGQQNQHRLDREPHDPPDGAAEASAALDRSSSSRDVQTLSPDERTFNTGFMARSRSGSMLLGVLSFVILGNSWRSSWPTPG